MSGFRSSISIPERNLIGTWHALARQRRLLTLFLGLGLITVFALAAPLTAQAQPLGYSCGTASSGTHCYALARSNGGIFHNAQGSTVKILVVQMQCSQCGGNNGTTAGFIDNEMWFSDFSDHWVETGYITQSNSLSTWEEYFWADKRPADCSSCLNYHSLGGVPSSDYNQYATFTVKRSGSTSFHVTISSPNASKNGDSTNNTMTPDGQDMGQELAGKAGASAPYARYIYRYYWNSSGVSTAIGINYNPNFNLNSPPWFNQIPGTTVGDFETHCC